MSRSGAPTGVKELAFAKLNSSTQTTTSTTAVDLSPALTVPDFVVPASGAVTVHGRFPTVQHSVDGGTVTFFLTDSANTQLAKGGGQVASAAAVASISFENRVSGLTPGATISGWKVRWNITTAGTGTLTHSNDPNSASVRVVSVV